MTDIAREFECAVLWKEKLPDDMNAWPDAARLTTENAVSQLLEKYPGSTVIADRGYCLERGARRFPDGVPAEFGFVLVREVKLNRAVAV